MSDLHFCFGQLYMVVDNFFLQKICIYHKYIVPLHPISRLSRSEVSGEKL